LSKKTPWTEKVVDDTIFCLAIEGAETIIQKHDLATGIYGTGESL
jgi:hypothetical protein